MADATKSTNSKDPNAPPPVPSISGVVAQLVYRSSKYFITIKNADNFLKLYKEKDTIDNNTANDVEVRIAVGQFLGTGASSKEAIENTISNLDKENTAEIKSGYFMVFEKLVGSDNKNPLCIKMDSIENISMTGENEDDPLIIVYTKPVSGGAAKRRLSKKAKHARRVRRNSRKSV